MVITKKSHFKQYPFVDRVHYIENFKEAVNNIGQKEFNVLVYYGIAGIGKTSLRKELPKYLKEYNLKYQHQEVIWASIDLQLERHREKTTFLVILKNELQRNSKIKFPAFEISHAIYWKKANPEIPLRKENYQCFEGDNAFDNFFEVVEKIPYFSLVPTVARLLKNSPDYFRNWWKTRGETELSQLSEKEPLEIEEMLSYFWAADLNNYLENTSKSAVLFIDTYEALWEKERGRGNFNARDEWIRELVSNLPKSFLWVICGREELRWEEVDKDWNNYLKQYKLEKLSEKDALDFLNRCGIKEKEIQRVILKGSEGVPYYLELAVDTYTEIAKTGAQVPENFATNRSEIFDRFMVYLSVPEQETLKILSIPRFWNKDIFKALIEEFKTGYSLTAFSELNRFSLVQETEDGKLQLHPLVRESLQTYQDQELKKEVHSFMCVYYNDQLKSVDIRRITQEHENALSEAFYHAKEALKTRYLLNWFISVSDSFNRAASWQLITPMYEEMLQIIRAELGPEHPDVATTLNNLAELYFHMGDYERALQLYNKALSIREKVLGPENPDVTTTLNNLAELYFHMGDYEKALQLYQRALDIREKVMGPQHPDVATSLNNLAELYFHMGDYKKALQLYQRALDIREKVLGSEHPNIAATLNNLAVLYFHMGDYEKALSLYNKALEINEKVLGLDHPDVATTLNNIAGVYRDLGRYEEALQLYRKSLDVREKLLGPEHPDVATTLNNIAGVYRDLGRYEEALQLYRRSLDVREKLLGPEHPDVAATLNNIAGVYRDLGKYEEALQLYHRSLDVREKLLGPEHPDVAATLNNIAGVYRDLGKYEEALQLYRRSLDVREKLLGPRHPEVANTLNNIAVLYRETRRYEEAFEMFNRALETLESVYGPLHPDVANTLNNIAALYRETGKNGQALEMYSRSLKTQENVYGPMHPEIAITLNNIAVLYREMGRYTEALEMFNRALEILKSVYGSNHPYIENVKRNMNLIKKDKGKKEDNLSNLVKMFGFLNKK